MSLLSLSDLLWCIQCGAQNKTQCEMRVTGVVCHTVSDRTANVKNNACLMIFKDVSGTSLSYEADLCLPPVLFDLSFYFLPMIPESRDITFFYSEKQSFINYRTKYY